MFGGDINVEFTVADISRWLIKAAGATANSAVANCTFALDNLELVYDSLELSPESNNMVMANFQQKLIIKSQSYFFGSNTLGTAGAGSYDLPMNLKLASMKQLFLYFTQPACLEGSFGAVNPNGTDIVFQSNGKTYPQRPIKLSNPSECFMQIRKSFGSIYSNQFCGSIGRVEFLRRDTADALYLGPSTSLSVGNKFYLAIDTELINTNKESLYNGIPTGINSTIRVNINTVLASATTNLYWACFDTLLEFDFTTGLTRAIF